MKKFLLLITIILLAIFLVPQSVKAQGKKLTMAGASGILKVELVKTDKRIEKLTVFLQDYDSPLTPYAQDFIIMADKYQIDWRLLPAISGIESTFGKRIPFNSYNAYGWNNGNYRFQSWEDSIEKMSRALKEKYYNQGLDTPYKIGRIYAPPSPFWGNKVNNLMEKIEPSSKDKAFLLLTLTI